MSSSHKHPAEPAPGDAYDFLTYFECDDAGVPAFHEVCAALRDVRKNPEWEFVWEGPTWQGRRVRTWAELFECQGRSTVHSRSIVLSFVVREHEESHT